MTTRIPLLDQLAGIIQDVLWKEGKKMSEPGWRSLKQAISLCNANQPTGEHLEGDVANQGRIAARLGEPADSNPYLGSADAEVWLNGFEDEQSKCRETEGRFIVCAANRYGDLIITGARHHDPIMNAQIKALRAAGAIPKSGRGEQGFIDQRGVFLNRWEALAVAVRAGQVNVRRKKSPPEDRLFSEDLY